MSMSPNSHRALLIDPGSRSVQEVRLSAEDWQDVTRLLGCRAFDIVRLARDGSEAMAVDDEGRLVYPHPHGYFRFINPGTGAPMSDWTCGRGLVMGCNPQTGATCDTGLMLATVYGAVEFASEPPPYAQVEPSMTFIPIN